MTLDEASARRVVLVQAIESVDTEGRLIGPAEIEQTEKELLGSTPGSPAQASAASDPPDALADMAPLLVQRADRLLARVESREPQIAALAHPSGWSPWLLWALPVLTLLLGLLTDRIADPHKVDLLSQPLLAIVLWNLVMYAVTLASALRPKGSAGSGPAADLRRWAAGVRLPGPANPFRDDVRLAFLRHWQRVSAPLNRWRVTRMLHLAAAGWATGVALSLVARGAVVEYHVGWESTWFDAAQVHAFLKVLLAPAVTLLGVAPLSLEEVAQLEISRNSVAEAGRRWVYLYATLLGVVVIVPRLLLAGLARWRERHLAGAVMLDEDQPYIQRLTGRMRPARVHVALRTDSAEDREALLRVLLPGQGVRAPAPAGGAATPVVLVRAGDGDLLQLLEVPAAAPLQLPGPQARSSGLRALVRRAWGPSAPPPPPGRAGNPPVDVVLQVVSARSQLGATASLQSEYGRPVLLLVRPGGTPMERDELLATCRQRQVKGEVDLLPFTEFARCWVQEDVLLAAVARRLAPAKLPGFARLRRAWERRHELRLERSMATVALQLGEAAREVEEIRSPALSVRDLLPAERRAAEQARKDATLRLAQRLQRSAELTLARLLELHDIDPRQAQPLELRLEEEFVVQGAVNTPQAGLAGAATGAAMGASVDLMVGGLTLGAAAALGALVGGGAATVAAAWKNKSTGAVTSSVAPSDEMLLGLTEAALLRYLAVAHFGRLGDDTGDAQVESRWKDEVEDVVHARRERLMSLWPAARKAQGGALGAQDAATASRPDTARGWRATLQAAPASPGPEAVTAQLAELLREMALEVLHRLYPGARNANGVPA